MEIKVKPWNIVETYESWIYPIEILGKTSFSDKRAFEANVYFISSKVLDQNCLGISCPILSILAWNIAKT